MSSSRTLTVTITMFRDALSISARQPAAVSCRGHNVTDGGGGNGHGEAQGWCSPISRSVPNTQFSYGRTPRLEVGCIQRRVEGRGGVTHTETAEEVRKDWEVGKLFFFFSKDLSHEAKAE